MADFSAQSASLSAPSGAGSQPVVTQVNNVSDGGLFDKAVGNIANLLGEGIKTYQATEQTKLQNAILGDVASKQNVINQAVQQGTMTAQEAHVRSGAIYSEALANYPQLADKFSSLNSVFKATTGQGDTEADLASQRTQAQHIAEANDNQAIGQGYYIAPTMSQAQRQTIWTAAQGNLQAQKEWENQKARIEFERSTNTYNQGQTDRDNKLFAIKTVNELAGSNFGAFNAQAQSLVDQVNTGKMTTEAAQIQLQQIRNQINGPLQAIAASGQIDASPYKQMFDQTYEIFNKQLDPKTRSENATAQVNEIIARQKLVYLGDPEIKSFTATSQLLGGNQNPLAFSTGARLTMKALSSASQTGTKDGIPAGFVAPIAGNPEVEGDALKTLKYATDQLRGGKMQDTAKGAVEVNNTVNNVLAQTGQLLNQGATPDRLKGLAEFFSSPQYAYLVQNGAIDPVAAQTAKKTFQMLYEPAVTQAVGSKLQGTLPDSNIPLNRAIDAQFTGAGVSFVVRKGLSPQDTVAAQAVADNLRTASQGMNTLVRLGSHMNGSTDYQKEWDNSKYALLPQLFPVKPGQAIKWQDGKTYTWNGSGDWADRNNWTVKDNGSK